MKVLIFACALALVGLSLADEQDGPTPTEAPLHPRGCIYIMGKCYKECEEGTHAYALGCGHKTPEPTCEQPHPVEEPWVMCDYSACYCDAPTVRDTTTGKCVQLSDCPKNDDVVKSEASSS